MQLLYNFHCGGDFMRISINLSEETLKKVDLEAQKMGITRSSMLSSWIGEKLSAIEMSRSFFNENFQDKMIEALKSSLNQKELEEVNNVLNKK